MHGRTTSRPKAKRKRARPAPKRLTAGAEGRMRVERDVPREVLCPSCGARMRPASTPKSFRWFKCDSCGLTHRHWRRFEWVPFQPQG